jgi:RNA polymerase sigma-54 factor
MRLEQRLTPQLVQSMEILQLPLMALEARVREELEQNPVLEVEDARSQTREEEPREDLPSTEVNNAEARSFERLDRMSREMEFDPGDLPYGRSTVARGERDSKIDAMANTAARSVCLREHLLQQWSLVDADEPVKDAAKLLIDWMDEDGYLRTEAEQEPNRNGNGAVGGEGENGALPLIIARTPQEREALLEEIALSRTPPVDRGVLDRAMTLVQGLEPLGVGACDLTECLLIQLQARGLDDPFLETIVREHLVDLARNHFPQVAKATGRSIEDLKEALKLIGRLSHHPGHVVSTVDVPRVTPDVIIDYSDEGDGYVVRLARGSSPRLRISRQYREMLQDGELDKETREFIKKRVESAGMLIDAIHFRRERMLEIAKIILERQREFFDFGPQFLKVLLMRDLAEEFGCDPSTISRTVDGKYIQTPRGLYPLRQFFSGGTTDGSGKSVSWNAIRMRVKEIVDQEDKQKPLSDDEILRKVNEAADVPIARRTIAKYRAQLGIPSQRERRAY